MLSLFGWFSPGLPELLIVGAILLLLFGNRLPSVMRSMGRGVIEFKKGVQGIEDDIEQAASEKKDAETEKEAVE
ncbi:MAG: Sec-independent protein translocase TatA [Planctomycetales bacterium]|nr:Sec-independent protein translocase TatA [Planctomycetales bacterium]NIP68208.1 Sec-independent protein translocase TatA [Planctomycetales bacterium]